MNRLPPLYGMVLVGGRSRRFGSDKAMFRPLPDGEPLVLRAVRLVQSACERAFVSLRAGQELPVELPAGVDRIADRHQDIGPLAGLLAGWRLHADVAWLVVACDLAALDIETLRRLTTARTSHRPATAYAHPEDGHPEPLCAIYEPIARRVLEAGMVEGNHSLRRYLRRVLAQDELLVPPNSRALANFNRPAEFGSSVESLRNCKQAGD